MFVFFFFFNDTATTEIYTLSLHDALRSRLVVESGARPGLTLAAVSVVIHAYALTFGGLLLLGGDRKSTRLNSSHLVISYAVFCLKKKKDIHHLLYLYIDYESSNSADILI